MVVTPDHRPLDSSEPLSPLLLASRGGSGDTFPGLGGSSGSGPQPPMLRKSSTGSFSKLSEFWLDGTPGPATPMESEAPSLIKDIPHVELSIDAR